jgi:hypothetical protein
MPKAIFCGTGVNGFSFWETDGTTIGTVEMPSLPTPYTHPATLGTAVVYSGGHDGGLYITDGTAAHTFPIVVYPPGLVYGGGPHTSWGE